MLELDEIAELVRDLSLDTDRLRVRRFAHRDIDVDVEHQRHPEVMRYIRPVPSREKAEADAQGFAEPWQSEEGAWCTFAVETRENAEYLGAIVFRIESVDRETAELGYRFHPDHHGHGFATEACRALLWFLFDTVQVHKVVALCAAPNVASYRLMERLGMRREAHLRGHCRLNGAWVDDLAYGLFAGELTVG